MKSIIKAIKYTVLYAMKSTVYGYKVVFRDADKTWAVLKGGEVYYMNTKRKCYEFVCLA